MSETAIEKEPEQEKDPESGSGQKGEGKPSKSPYKILVVDDEQKFLTLVLKVFRSVGFQIETCDDPEQALDRIESQGPYAVVISDNRMASMRGTEFLNKLKVVSPDTVRILATAYFDNTLLQEVINRAEPYRFLKKPIDYKLMVQSVQESLRKYEKNLEITRMAQKVEALDKVNQTARTESADLQMRIAGLQKTLKMFTMGVALFVILVVGGVGVTRLMEDNAIEEKSVRMGAWVLFPNQTALDTDSQNMWMTVDFRQLEQHAPKNWSEAMTWPDKINKRKFAGFTDWRVPTIAEYQSTYDPQPSRVAFDNRTDLRVGYPKAFEDGGGYGFWASDATGTDSAAYFFFVGGYSKIVSREFNNPTMSVRLVRTVN